MCKKSLQENTKRTILQVFETRKKIDALLNLKAENAKTKDITGTTRKEIDASVWNELGLYFLNNRMFLDAAMVYQHMLDVIPKIEQEKGITIHKGLPLHNLGVAQIRLKNYDEGIPNILRAYDEDVATYGKTEADGSLANQVKEGLISFISKVVDGNYLKWFNDNSGLTIKNTFSLLTNMDETEKLYFAKIVTSKKLLTFHDDVYTRNAMLDNLRDLALLLESNLKRRSGENRYLPESIAAIFSEEWKNHFVANDALKNFDGTRAVQSFQDNVNAIRILRSSGRPEVDFLTNSFLTTALVRNFAAHFVVDNLNILKNHTEYDDIFGKEIAATLYSLNYRIP
jgi:hypothetical protein